jgi:hypothetical protein
MPALGAGIHVFLPSGQSKTWMAGTCPAMTGQVIGNDDAQKSLPSFATAGSLRLREDPSHRHTQRNAY